MAKKKEVIEQELQNEAVAPTLETVINEEIVEIVDDSFVETIKEEVTEIVGVEKPGLQGMPHYRNVEPTVDEPVVTPKNIVEDIQLKTEFEVGDSVKIDDKPYKVVKVKITKSYDLEDQFGRVERNVYAHLVKDNSVNIAAFVAKSNEL